MITSMDYTLLLVNSPEQFFENCPIEMPCHSYAIGILLDYEIGELLGAEPIDARSSDWELLSTLQEELRTVFGLTMEEIDYSVMNHLIADNQHIIQITRMSTPCRDYHFYFYHSDGSISHKYRHFTPQRVNHISYMAEEYSLGFYVIKRRN